MWAALPPGANSTLWALLVHWEPVFTCWRRRKARSAGFNPPRLVGARLPPALLPPQTAEAQPRRYSSSRSNVAGLSGRIATQPGTL